MAEKEFILRCPRCGSMDAESIEPVGIEFDRMKCRTCGHDDICDNWEIKDYWAEYVDPARVRRDQWHLLPSGRFNHVWEALGGRGWGRDEYGRLCEAYDEPHRHYHGSSHIGACLRLLDDPAVKAAAEKLNEVEAALWFHDAVYDTHERNNEERSAALAAELLAEGGAAAEAVARIAGHIRATRTHLADDADGRLVVDIDLAILGADRVEFERYEELIRREFDWVDPVSFAAGRATVLRRFEMREHIFATPVLRERFEEKARQNIARSMRRLERPGA